MIHLKIKEFLQQNKAAMIAFRRQLHQHPELSWEEVQTTKDIAAQLDEIGVSDGDIDDRDGHDDFEVSPADPVPSVVGHIPGDHCLLLRDLGHGLAVQVQPA